VQKYLQIVRIPANCNLGSIAKDRIRFSIIFWMRGLRITLRPEHWRLRVSYSVKQQDLFVSTDSKSKSNELLQYINGSQEDSA